MSTLARTGANAIDESFIDEINRQHKAVEEAATRSLEHAIECGRLLRAAKDRVGHGEWLRWLTDNFDGSERMARNYMTLHEHADVLHGPNRQRVADFSIRAALREIAPPREKEPAADERLHRIFPGLNAPGAPAGRELPAPPDTPPTPAPPPAAAPPAAHGHAIDAEARVLHDPPAALDPDLHRQHEKKEATVADLLDLNDEELTPGLAALSLADVYRDASHKSRALAGQLEQLAIAIEARERRRRPAA